MTLHIKRNNMTLFSDASDYYCHCLRMVLAEKGVAVDVVDINDEDCHEDLADLNPYSCLPTLVDRDLVLYDASILMEYLDERFPYPPLLPVYPVARAQSRLYMYRIKRDWYNFAKIIQNSIDEQEIATAQADLKSSLIATVPIFSENEFFISDEFTLVDCCLAPFLWRLPMLGIDLSQNQAGPILNYMDRMFAREGFINSLSELEKEMRL